MSAATLTRAERTAKHDPDNPLAEAFNELRLHCAAIEVALRECECAVEQLTEVLHCFAASSLADVPNVHLPRLHARLVSIISVEAYTAFCAWDDATEGEGYPTEESYRAREAAAEAGDADAQAELVLYQDYDLLQAILESARNCTAIEQIIRTTLGPPERAPTGVH